MDEKALKEYLFKEFRFNNHVKYVGRFDEWYDKLTLNQKMYYYAYAKGSKTPFSID